MEKIDKSNNNEKTTEDNNNSKLIILYDEYQFSLEQTTEKIANIFSSIESHTKEKNQKNKFFFHPKENKITLSNKYYTCDILYQIHSLNKIDEINLKEFEGIILFLEDTSIKNKIFKEKSNFFDEKENAFASCIIIFEEDREDLQTIELYDGFIGDTIDKHFEVICGCENLKIFDEDDGIGAINLSLHSTQWKGSKINNGKNNNKEINKDVIKNEEKIKEEDNKIVNKKGNLKENKEDKEEEKLKNLYKELNDGEEIDRVFGKIKEIKQINSNPNISDEERRNNAEKAVMMLMNMFHLEEDEEDELNDDEDKK